MQRKTNVFKRVFFSPTQEEFFANASFLKNLFFQRTGFVRNWSDITSNVNRFVESVCELDTTHLRTDRRATDNN